ncbi:metallophosphoesterase family protein [Litoreibacter albidus]|uniref:metallophosphoesterase family protein n=1 Tax=Litoreibacter albidus TaxID=670155 RepID=UPI00373647B9
MRNILRALRPSSKPQAVPVDTTSLLPAQAVYAIGDIHGCVDLIEPLLARIDTDIGRRDSTPVHLVFLGDYVDRGPDSAGVLALLYEMAQKMPEMVTCLMGNHERMMLDFIDDPAGRGGRWLNNGGNETLASYGIGKVSSKAPLEDMTEAADALVAALPDGMEAWLRALPLQWQSGNLVCVHAAMNPARTPKEQHARTLLWGHRDFMTTPREDGVWVIHGHTIVKTPDITDKRIAIDTGAFRTGQLTAAAITEGVCRFL